MKETRFVKKTKELLNNLDTNFIKQLDVFDRLESTNITAKELARTGADEGTLVIARTQHHGRGRFNRVWQSPEGGAYLSIILRPKKSINKISLLPFVAVLAVARTIHLYGLHPTIKWPNDIQVNGKKIAGILLESEIKESEIIYIVVGIGVNLNINRKDLSPEIRNQSTSMYHELGFRVVYHDFLRIFFKQFEEVYSLFINHRFKIIIDEWKIHTDTLGKKISVRTPTETLEGTAIDIDSSGFLLIRTDNGEIKKILSGDCFYLNEFNHI